MQGAFVFFLRAGTSLHSSRPQQGQRRDHIFLLPSSGAVSDLNFSSPSSVHFAVLTVATACRLLHIVVWQIHCPLSSPLHLKQLYALQRDIPARVPPHPSSKNAYPPPHPPLSRSHPRHRAKSRSNQRRSDPSAHLHYSSKDDARTKSRLLCSCQSFPHD